jgi:hypothetical protein
MEISDRDAERVVCDIFKCNGAEFIAKPKLIRALAMLWQEIPKHLNAIEQLAMDLFCENPLHVRFAKIPVSQLTAMRAEAERRKAVEQQTKAVEAAKIKRAETLTASESSCK